MVNKWYKLKQIEDDLYALKIVKAYQSRRCLTRNSFSQLAFDVDEEYLITTDLKGNLYFVTSIDKDPCYKVLGIIGMTTFLAFNPLDKCEIIAGLISADIKILRIDLSIDNYYLLLGHAVPPMYISFYKNNCLTCSNRELIIWCLKSWNRMYQLKVDVKDSTIKKAKFSNTGIVVAVYSTGIIQAWELKYLDQSIKINTKKFGLQNVKDFDFTKDGRAMIIAGTQSKILILNTNNWTILKNFNLPENITSRTLYVLPVPLDGGANKIAAVLSSDEILRVLDLNSACFLKTSKFVTGVRKAIVSPKGRYIVYVDKHEHLYIINSKKLLRGKVVLSKRDEQTCKSCIHTCVHHIQCTRKNMKRELNLDRLMSILKEFGEYPDKYRMVIWSIILVLPSNKSAYVTLSNEVANDSYSLDILQKCYLADQSKTSLLNVTIKCLVQWCPMLALTSYLPKLVFPFIVVCQKNSLIAFELILSVLLNFCQKWFEYHPLPPMNVLGIIENILSETDPHLLQIFCERGITSTQYAWPLLQTTLSEVLSAREWLLLWDHLITLSEPTLLLFCIIAYNICSREIIISSLHSVQDFVQFYNTQSNIRTKNLLNIALQLNKKVSYRFHPSQYFRSEMKTLSAKGPYQPFLLSEYPKFVNDNFNYLHKSSQKNKRKIGDEEDSEILEFSEKTRLDEEMKTLISDVHKTRLNEIHKCIHEQMKNGHSIIKNVVEFQNIFKCNECKSLRKPLVNISKCNIKRNLLTFDNYGRLKEDIQQLENEVRNFLQNIRPSRS